MWFNFQCALNHINGNVRGVVHFISKNTASKKKNTMPFWTTHCVRVCTYNNLRPKIIIIATKPSCYLMQITKLQTINGRVNQIDRKLNFFFLSFSSPLVGWSFLLIIKNSCCDPCYADALCIFEFLNRTNSEITKWRKENVPYCATQTYILTWVQCKPCEWEWVGEEREKRPLFKDFFLGSTWVRTWVHAYFRIYHQNSLPFLHRYTNTH